ncbi:hypothetical protein MMC28_011680 [Mycoblastus sanguinarius]|nr:hypothetical protein [Mycoblastus sanguinarius]
MFKHFQYWIYSETILASDEYDIEWRTLTNLYIFSEARRIPNLQNAAMDVLIDTEMSRSCISIAELSHVYDNTAESSTLRKFLVDWAAQRVDLAKESRFGAANKDYFPKHFLFDLTIALYLRVENGTRIADFKAVRSNYHVSYSDTRTESHEDSEHKKEVSRLLMGLSPLILPL